MNAMLRVVSLQACAAVIAALGAGVWAGQEALASAALGSAVYLLPNALLAWKLQAAARRPTGARPLDFLVGECLKLGLSLSLLVTVVLLWPGVHWLAFLGGLFVVLKANLLAFLIRT